jgi:hypothetical protein
MSNGGLKLKVMPKFPSQVIGRAGIDVTIENGNFYLDIDFTDFPMSANSPPNTNLYVLAYDVVAKTFVLVPK